MENILKHQEHMETDKTFNPGQLECINTPLCKTKLVNFFGDVHTEVFSMRVSKNDKYVAVACSNGEAKVYDIY